MKSNAVRDQIMDTASRLFYTQGYNNTGINQIIGEAGIAKASLYQHFRSKEDLLIEYLELAGLRMNDMLHVAIDAQQDPKDKITAVFDLLDQLTRRKAFNGCRFLNIISEVPVTNERIREQVKAQKDSVRKLFREILSPLKKEEVADELYLLFEAVFISSKIYGQGWPVSLARKMAQKLI
ncbi:MAG: TetR/AcrR family transcriptional regulator [Chitinophagaceae bacterium]|nr:MAG: TetR/AcrR family transcriptional regulator [Chitinophagaceae bacterium]